jgi:hypothetical protein
VDPSQGDGGAGPGADCSDLEAEQGCGISVLGEFNHCPRVSFDATPIQTFVERGVQVQSMSFDPEGDVLAYEWTAEPDGMFVDSTAILTRYVCASIGRKTLSLKVMDARGCDSLGSLEVSCVDVSDFLRSGVTTITDTP